MSVRFIKTRWHESCGYKEILSLAWPLVLGTCSVTIQQFINRIFLTWYSSESLAAATPAGAISFLAICLPIGIVSYVSTFIAQYHGAGMNRKIAGCVWQSIYISIFFSILVLCVLPYSHELFALTKHAPNLIKLETTYFNIMVAGSFFAICGSGVSGFFMGLGKTRVLLGVNILATVVNIILDYLLIFGHFGFPEMGISGAALATIISSAVSFFALTILLFTKENRSEYQTHSNWQINMKLIKRMVRYGFPNGMQLSVDVLIWSLFLLLVGRLGIIDLAATNIAFQVNSVAFMPVLGIGSAVGIIVARELGRYAAESAYKSVISALQIAMAYNVLMTILYVGLPMIFIYPFTSRAEPSQANQLYRLSVILLRFMAVYIVADSITITLASALRAAGDTIFVMCTLIVLGLFCIVIPTYYAIRPGGGGIILAWSLVTIYVFILSITFYLRFRQGKWKHMRIIEQAPLLSDEITEMN